MAKSMEGGCRTGSDDGKSSMQELIERVGIPLFIEIVIELWNREFLPNMILSFHFRKQNYKNKVTNYDDIPYSKELFALYTIPNGLVPLCFV